MDTYASYKETQGCVETAVAIGNFDGIHRGHQALLRTARDAAVRLGVDWSILTFSPHPSVLLAPERAPVMLMSDRQKLEAFQALGVRRAWLQSFSHDFAQLEPEAFVQEVLSNGLGARHVVVGFDFRYGRNRLGTVDSLKTSLDSLGIGLTVVKPVEDGEQKVSSSEIRRAILGADLERAEALLGHSYGVHGLVQHGDARGRTLGFPTLNISVSGQIYPGEGVYCGWVKHKDEWLSAVANLGSRPTVGDRRKDQLEIHVIDTELGELYGESVDFVFHSKIREVLSFSTLGDLKDQIADDTAIAQSRLSSKQPKRLSLA